METLARLAAELNHRLELQKRKEERGCSPTGALWGPPAVRPKLEQRVRRCGPTDDLSVVRPAMEQDQQNYACGSAAGANSNGMSTKSNVSMCRLQRRIIDKLYCRQFRDNLSRAFGEIEDKWKES